MQLAFYFDQTRCIGCNTCVIACKDWNKINPGPVRMRNPHTMEGTGTFPNQTVHNLPYSCNHCANPACIPACAANAIYKRDEDGVVLIDRDKCQGLGSCLTACPFNAPKRMSDKQEPVQDATFTTSHPAIKCTFCWDRLAVGDAPACVAACGARALDFGPMDNLMASYPDAIMANSADVFGFPDSTKDSNGINLPNGDTQPSLLVKPKSGVGLTDMANFKENLFIPPKTW